MTRARSPTSRPSGGAWRAVLGAEDFELDGAEFAVGDDEKAVAAAGGVEKAEGGEAVVELLEAFLATGGGGGDLGEFGLEVVEKERVDEAADVFLGGIVGAFGAALGGLHDALEEGAEDAGGDARPVELAAAEEGGAVGGRHVGDVESLGEKTAVDVGVGGELGGEGGGAGGGFLVEDLEESGEAGAEVGAVLARGLDEAGEAVPLKDIGVFGEEAEEEADEEAFEGVAGVAGFL